MLHPSMIQDMKDNIRHNIPFISDMITRPMPKVTKGNIKIFFAQTNKNSFRLHSIFFFIGRTLE